MTRGPDGPRPSDDGGEPDEPAAEAADPLNPDAAPGTSAGDDIYDAMLEENRSATGEDDAT